MDNEMINLVDTPEDVVIVIDVYYYDEVTKALIGKGTALSNDIPSNATRVPVSLEAPKDRIWCFNEDLQTWIAKHVKQVENNTDEKVVEVYIYDPTTLIYQYKDTVFESKKPKNSTTDSPNTQLDYFYNDHWVTPGSPEDTAIKKEREAQLGTLPRKRTPEQNEAYFKELNQKAMSNIQMLGILESGGLELDEEQAKLLKDCKAFVVKLMMFHKSADFNNPTLEFPPIPENFDKFM